MAPADPPPPPPSRSGSDMDHPIQPVQPVQPVQAMHHPPHLRHFLQPPERPITAPTHGLFTSPARSHAGGGQGVHGKELPLHLIAVILAHVDNAGDLARITRASRLFYYMALPQLYEHVTLRAYADIRHVDGRPEGYGNGSPFAMGLNTLVSRNFTEHVRSFRVVGDWREHDLDDYAKGRVPDNSMMLQIALRAALDKMHTLETFAWELTTKPMQTIYQSLMTRPSITSLTLRCPSKRVPRPTTQVPPLPNLVTLVVYDIDPLCYPDDVSLLILQAKKLENLKLHFSPRMREAAEESINMMSYFGRCVAAKYLMPLKRIALYNLYTRLTDAFESANDMTTLEEMTLINCRGSSDPMTVFLDDTWRVTTGNIVAPNLKMLRQNAVDKDHVAMLARHEGIQRLYLLSGWRRKPSSSPSNSRSNSGTTSPPTPNNHTKSKPQTPSHYIYPQNGAIASGAIGVANMPQVLSEYECISLASTYLAVIQSNHRSIRHLLLPDIWRISDDALFKLCQSCPDLEQLGLACDIPPLESLRQILGLVPKLYALRILFSRGSEEEGRFEAMEDMHGFVLATELWKHEYRNLRYLGLGDLCFRLGETIYPSGYKKAPEANGGGTPNGAGAGLEGPHAHKVDNSLNARRLGPIRSMTRVEWDEVRHVEIWGMGDMEFDPKFP